MLQKMIFNWFSVVVFALLCVLFSGLVLLPYALDDVTPAWQSFLIVMFFFGLFILILIQIDHTAQLVIARNQERELKQEHPIFETTPMVDKEVEEKVEESIKPPTVKKEKLVLPDLSKKPRTTRKKIVKAE